MFFRLNSSGKPSYLQIVESFRVGKKVHQRGIANVGRYDRRAQSGALERLLATCDDANRRGPGFRFDVGRTVFLSVLHRICSPGSDRSALRWARDQAVIGVWDLQLQHSYRAVA